MKAQREASAPIPAAEERRPSDVTDVYRLSAGRRVAQYPSATGHCGKWLVFVPVPKVDEVWSKIKLATEEGKLCDSAKVATARPNPNEASPGKRVICVYTYDWTDEVDVGRVRQALRELGITWKIPYKADEDTYAGRYANRGNERISKYYE
jgi:hypothetical protein